MDVIKRLVELRDRRLHEYFHEHDDMGEPNLRIYLNGILLGRYTDIVIATPSAGETAFHKANTFLNMNETSTTFYKSLHCYNILSNSQVMQATSGVRTRSKSASLKYRI